METHPPRNIVRVYCLLQTAETNLNYLFGFIIFVLFQKFIEETFFSSPSYEEERTQFWTTEIVIRCKKTNYGNVQALEEVAQGSCGLSDLKAIKNPTVHGPEQPDRAGGAQSKGVD